MGNRVTILIVEDEVLLAQDIKMRLTKLGYHVAQVASTVNEARKCIESHRFDLIILDIILKGELDGIDLAAEINKFHRTPFIFLTSNADQQLVDRAMKVNPSAYMLKPFNDREIAITMELALANSMQRNSQSLHNEKINTGVLSIKDSLFLKKDKHFEKVLLSDLAILEADNNYTTVYTRDGKFIYSTVLKKMEEKLPSSDFIRVHRSYVVNVQAIEGFEGNILFVNNMKIPVSKQYREEVFRIFKIL